MRTFALAAAVAVAAGLWLGREATAALAVASDASSAGAVPAGSSRLAEIQSVDCCWIYVGGRWWCVPC